MKRIVLNKGVTTSDVSQLADAGIFTAEAKIYNEFQQRHFEYSALCENQADVDIVNKLNNEISVRGSVKK